jgi:hypothetical protein
LIQATVLLARINAPVGITLFTDAIVADPWRAARLAFGCSLLPTAGFARAGAPAIGPWARIAVLVGRRRADLWHGADAA